MNDIPTHAPMTVRRSPEINELAEALAMAQGEFPIIEKKRIARVKGKTKEGKPYDYSFKYADLGDVLSTALPILSKHGIAFTQPTVCEGGVIYIRTTLMHKSGQWQESDYPVIRFEGGMKHQSGGEALTFAKRYAGCAALGIAPEETVEGDTDMGGDAEISGGAPMRSSRARNEAPSVVQGTQGKDLPPVVGGQKPDEPFYLTDRYGNPDMEPMDEQTFVAALVKEMNDCTVYQAVGQVMEHNGEMIHRVGEVGKKRVSNAYDARCKALRREMHADEESEAQ